MKILSPINENKDLVNKEYVDSHSGGDNSVKVIDMADLSDLTTAHSYFDGIIVDGKPIPTFLKDQRMILELTNFSQDSQEIEGVEVYYNNYHFGFTYNTGGGNIYYPVTSMVIYRVPTNTSYPVIMESNASVGLTYDIASQAFQEKLESGTNIKTINNQSILGSGNLTVSGSFYDYDDSQTPYDIPYNYAGVNSFDGITININNQDVSVVGIVYSFLQFSLSYLKTLLSDIVQYAEALYVPTASFIPNADSSLTIIIPGYGVAIFPLVLDNDHYKANGVMLLSYHYGFAALFTSNGVTTTYDISEKQDNLVSGTNIKTINNQSLLGSGNISISGGSSIDVQINGTSIVNNDVANILTQTAYNASTNKLATMTDIANAITTALNTPV